MEGSEVVIARACMHGNLSTVAPAPLPHIPVCILRQPAMSRSLLCKIELVENVQEISELKCTK